MSGRVLRLVEHDDGVVERAAAHEGQRCYLYHVALHELAQLGAGYHVFECVVERLQVGVDFLLHVARQETQLLAGLHSRARENDLAHLLVLERPHGQCHCQIGLARAGRAQGKGEVVFAEGFHQQLLVGGAARDGLAVHAIHDHVVHLELLGRLALDGVEYHVFGELVVLEAIGLKLLYLVLEVSCFLIVAYHGDHAAAGSHAQLGKEVAYELDIGVVHPVENHWVNAVDQYMPFYHRRL